MSEPVKWEYRIITVGGTFSQPKDDEFEATLNEMGEEGWEVVAVHNLESTNKVRVIAKRPLERRTQRRRNWPE
jgi:hypothetical protein